MLLTITSHQKKEVIDITDTVTKLLEKSEIKSGMVNLFLLHTTAALTTADLDPGTDKDYLDAFDAIMPQLNYRHPHDPAHVVDHILASMIGPSLNVPIENGEPILGTWQRIVLIELDGPRDREIQVNIFKDGQSI